MGTDAIAAFATVVGAVVAAASLWLQRRATRPQVGVAASPCFLMAGPDLSDPVLLIEAANTGSRSVTLNDAGIRLHGPDYKWISLALTSQSNVRFPRDLLPGKICSAWIGFRELACGLKADGYTGLIRLIAFYPDQAGRK